MRKTDITLSGSIVSGSVSVLIFSGDLRRFSERRRGKVCSQQYPSDVKDRIAFSSTGEEQNKTE